MSEDHSMMLLLSKYLDGNMNDREAEQLTLLLDQRELTDSQNRPLLDHLWLHLLLQQLSEKEQPQDSFHAQKSIDPSLSVFGQLSSEEIVRLLDSIADSVCPAPLEVDTPTPRVPIRHSAPSSKKNKNGYGLGLALTFLAIAAFFVFISIFQNDVKHNNRASETEQYAMQIRHSANVTWIDSNLSRYSGESVPYGPLKLLSGTFSAFLSDGTELIVEGPADMVFPTGGDIHVKRGKLSLNVPRRTQPLRVVLADYTVVVHGTAFSAVSSEQETRVDLFEGSVTLQDFSNDPGRIEELKPNESFRFTRSQGGRRARAETVHWIDQLEMLRRVIKSQDKASVQYKAFFETLSQSPGLLAALDFDPSKSSLQPPFTGDFTAGRWPWKKALRFRQSSDQFNLSLKDNTSSLTFTAWVKLDQLDRHLNPILMSENFDPLSVQWFIDPKGEVCLNIPDTENPMPYKRAPVFRRGRLNTWVHLAVTVDAKERLLIHYVNGVEAIRDTFRSKRRINLGPMLIGNSGNLSMSGGPKNLFLHGCIDEMLIFERALTAEEIHQIYMMNIKN